jgi:hypothetical protein
MLDVVLASLRSVCPSMMICHPKPDNAFASSPSALFSIVSQHDA